MTFLNLKVNRSHVAVALAVMAFNLPSAGARRILSLSEHLAPESVLAEVLGKQTLASTEAGTRQTRQKEMRTSGFSLGEFVEVRRDLAEPLHGWGDVQAGLCGQVAIIARDRIYVDFPTGGRWRAEPDELMNCQAHPGRMPNFGRYGDDRRTHYELGDRVQIKENVREPKHGMGRVQPGACGSISQVSSTQLIIDFDEQSEFAADLDEVEDCQISAEVLRSLDFSIDSDVLASGEEPLQDLRAP